VPSVAAQHNTQKCATNCSDEGNVPLHKELVTKLRDKINYRAYIKSHDRPKFLLERRDTATTL
jgi:hypothetical protein